MEAVRLKDLKKTFKLKQKAAGLGGSIKALYKPQWQTVEAVKGVSLEIETGELVAFIGPNGAGKSTTIKMLTGILFPTSGQARVLGLVPWQQRTLLAHNIAAVFGQK